MPLDAVLTVPSAKPAPVIAVVAAACVSPTTLGTSDADSLAVQAAVAAEVDGLQHNQRRKIQRVVAEICRTRK